MVDRALLHLIGGPKDLKSLNYDMVLMSSLWALVNYTYICPAGFRIPCTLLFLICAASNRTSVLGAIIIIIIDMNMFKVSNKQPLFTRCFGVSVFRRFGSDRNTIHS